MKKIFSFVMVLTSLFLGLEAFSQCTPNSAQTDFLVPDTATNFADATVGVPYEQILYISVPSDTTVYSLPTTIYELTLLSVDGLPAGINYATNPANAVFNGGSQGCIQFAGTATDTGTYDLTMYVSAHVSVFLVGDTTITLPVEGYRIKVLPDNSSIGKVDDNRFTVFQNSPNPFTGKTEIAFQSPGNENVTCEIFDADGKSLFSKRIQSVQGYNAFIFDASSYPAGVYIYKISNGELTVTHRMSLLGK